MRTRNPQRLPHVARGNPRALSVSLVATGLAGALALGGLGGGAIASADEDVPSRTQVAEAEDAVLDRAGDLAATRARLAVADERLRMAAQSAAQAAEAYNGARWAAAEARRELRASQRSAARAGELSERQRRVYADAMVASYQLAPELSALAALTESDGIAAVLETTTVVGNAQEALDQRAQAYRAASTVAEVSAGQAAQAEDRARESAEQARAARDAAAGAARAAAEEAAAVAAEKSALVADLARLEGISVALAERRQSALERRAAETAAAAAEAESAAAAQQATQPAPSAPLDPDPAPVAQPAQPSQPAQPAPPAPAPTPAPPVASGAAAAVAFARAQLGEPYRWAAAGPDAWDCSGLTSGAWAAGGKSLPHYSVAQYEQSTPIGAGDLRAGDLVFWGSTSSPSSIFHVALYVGDGRIVHAPRTGRPVTEESMYYWTPPTFHARP
ncbi:NlpC/P60 family protein [Nocardioides ochotonae]|uniref:NlpC/P60 family protein n=1 Tax=Nocardioides ochotonae TaxID=2685869 RepID=UPI0014088A8F